SARTRRSRRARGRTRASPGRGRAWRGILAPARAPALARAAGELVRRQRDRPARQRVVALGQDREAAVLVRQRVLGPEGLRVGVADHAVDLARPQAARLEHAPALLARATA